MIKHDCYWYHCEHQMGASIDCCTLASGLGDCPCSDDCCNYVSSIEVTKRLKALSAFKSYFDSLYGQGLDVVNYHLNGATEPFDNFYDSAMEEYSNA